MTFEIEKEFLIASTRRCVVLWAKNIDEALEKGMKALDQDPKYGNVSGVPKPTTREEWVELRGKLVVDNGEHFECLGYPNYMGQKLIEHCEWEIDSIDAERTMNDE